jgi:hypothetical protein
MVLEQAYTLILGDDLFEFETNSIVTTIGSGGSSMGQRPRP